jgi:adenylosuccinate synthase
MRRTAEHLPLGLWPRAYLDRLQTLSGAPLRYVSVGTRRDQIIEV